MTYSEDIMQAARELYIALAKTDFQSEILPKGEAACRSGEYDQDQEMQVIAAAIATERARHQWQPIETAPKDGTHILIKPVRPFNPICEAFWVDDDGGYWSDGFASCVDADVSHWMPLPLPPQKASLRETILAMGE